MSLTRFKSRHVHTKATYLIKILVLDKMCNKYDISIATSVFIIFSFEMKKTSKKMYWVHPSHLAKENYDDLMINPNRVDIALSGDLRYEYKMYELKY